MSECVSEWTVRAINDDRLLGEIDRLTHADVRSAHSDVLAPLD